MTSEQVTYLVFGIILVLALIFDLGLISKKNKTVTIRQALQQTFFWVTLALAFFILSGIKGAANRIRVYQRLPDGMELKH
jgi:tellurite resistance protein TerC